MKEKLFALESEEDGEPRMQLIRSLLGMVTYQMSIYPTGSEHNIRLNRRRQWLWNEFRKAGQRNDISEATKREQVKTLTLTYSDIPWT